MGCKYPPSVDVTDVYVNTFQVLRTVIFVALMFSRKYKEHKHFPALIPINLLRNCLKSKVHKDVYLTFNTHRVKSLSLMFTVSYVQL